MLHRRAALLLPPVIFGGFDGANSILGIINGVPADHMVRACASGAVSAGMSMAAGAWLSKRSDSGALEAVVIGVATAVGTVLPSLPYLALRGTAALVGVVAILLALGAVISIVRTHIPVAEDQPVERLGRAAFETYTVLLLVGAAVAACALISPGGAS